MQKLMMVIFLLFSTNSFAGILNKQPSKDFLAKKIGIWVPSISEPEAKEYTLQEFTQNAFRNVTSSSWEESNDSWILIIKIKDPMTKKKSTFKMQFLKSDTVAGPRRITVDADDFPMQNASPFMHNLLDNVGEKIGRKESPASQKKQFIDQLLGKHCWDDYKLEIKKADPKNLSISLSGKSCKLTDKIISIKSSNEEKVVAELKPGCSLTIQNSSFSDGPRTNISLQWDCGNELKSIFGCDAIPAMPNICD